MIYVNTLIDIYLNNVSYISNYKMKGLTTAFR